VADLIEHLESFLGPMSGGSRGDETTPKGVQVAWFPDRPFDGVTTLVTLGLSRRHLGMPNGNALHQELLMHVPNGEDALRAVALLFKVAGQMVDRGTALRRAQVIGPSGPLFPGSRTTAMVAISPVLLPEEFAVCRIEEDVPVVIAWLAPLTTGEVEVLRRDGWRRWSSCWWGRTQIWLTRTGPK
jgi:hypothetical protein